MDLESIDINLNNWEIIKNYVDNPKKPVKTDIGTLSEFIPKKAAAFEVYKETRQLKIMSLTIIMAVLATAIASAFNTIAGAASAGIFSILATFGLIKSFEKMKYFEEEYNINPKAK